MDYNYKITLTDEEIKFLNDICLEEGCTIHEFILVMIKSFIQLSPFHIDTLKLFLD